MADEWKFKKYIVDLKPIHISPMAEEGWYKISLNQVKYIDKIFTYFGMKL